MYFVFLPTTAWLKLEAGMSCSPQHLEEELDTVYNICLCNRFSPYKISTLMSTVRDRLLHPFVHCVVIPYHPDLSSRLKRTLNLYNIDLLT